MADAASIPMQPAKLDRFAQVEALIAHYNAQDADAYAAMLTEGGSEANYRGATLREGRDGVRAGLVKMFAEFPENRAEILQKFQLGDTVLLHERVYRSKATAPFEVMSIYSFEGDKIERVEFIR